MHCTFKLLSMAGNQFRWTKTPSFFQEALSFHLYQTAQFAHCLAVIENKLCGNEELDAGHITTLALYHDAGEVISEDVNGLFKNISGTFKNKVKNCEDESNSILVKTMPVELQSVFDEVFNQKSKVDAKTKKLLKAADLLSALSKIKVELLAGNQCYERAHSNTLNELNEYKNELVSVDYFIEHFMPAFGMHTEDVVSDQLTPMFK